jgi:hypothetical protein
MVFDGRFSKIGLGKGEMVRQERTALLVTEAAGKTPPPARPNMPVLGPGDTGG